MYAIRFNYAKTLSRFPPCICGNCKLTLWLMEVRTTLQNLPIGIQNFEKLREGNFLYVDKTGRKVVILVDEYDKPMLQVLVG